MLDEIIGVSDPFSTWAKLIRYSEKFTKKGDEWIFRGQQRSKLRLQTTLERAILSFEIDSPKISNRNDSRKREASERKLQKEVLRKGLDGRSVLDLEGGFLRKFMRQYHLYSTVAPDKNNTMEWLALMRHYGVPSRLLDWTFSFFVALYFAIEELDSECSVYALNIDWLRGKLSPAYPNQLKLLDEERNVTQENTFQEVFRRKDPLQFVYPVNPFRQPERSVIQQGIFLCPGDISIPFEENLEFLADRNSKQNFVKIEIRADLEQRKDILRRLHRMNMNRATFFPGLDGFGQSLRTLLVIPEILAPFEQTDHSTRPR